MGDYAAAQRHTDHGIATYDPDRHHQLTYIYTGHDPGVCCRNISAMMLWLRGYPDQALARCQEAMALAERVSHPFSMVLAQLHCSYVHLFRREPDEARRRVDKWIALSKEFGLSPTMMADGRFHPGWALADEGARGGRR